ncbi:hypothetical protein DID75_04490 [Candidatus Marinamargulisbacteria bacterium SCGC AG-410-N11]|nr:hypothetical protein DID75_04490 [Candidatus Marinamargulisbacteria bacterium SCGC AG-410-N11]
MRKVLSVNCDCFATKNGKDVLTKSTLYTHFEILSLLNQIDGLESLIGSRKFNKLVCYFKDSLNLIQISSMSYFSLKRDMFEFVDTLLDRSYQRIYNKTNNQNQFYQYSEYFEDKISHLSYQKPVIKGQLRYLFNKLSFSAVELDCLIDKKYDMEQVLLNSLKIALDRLLGQHEVDIETFLVNKMEAIPNESFCFLKYKQRITTLFIKQLNHIIKLEISTWKKQFPNDLTRVFDFSEIESLIKEYEYSFKKLIDPLKYIPLNLNQYNTCYYSLEELQILRKLLTNLFVLSQRHLHVLLNTKITKNNQANYSISKSEFNLIQRYKQFVHSIVGFKPLVQYTALPLLSPKSILVNLGVSNWVPSLRQSSFFDLDFNPLLLVSKRLHKAI